MTNLPINRQKINKFTNPVQITVVFAFILFLII